MTRPFRQVIDEGIVDRAAALFAQHGFTLTSVKALADAVGLSKAGLLHHFPTKEALYDAAHALARGRAREVRDRVVDLPLGPDRDRRALELLVDIAFERPGVVALLLRQVTAPEPTASPMADDDLAVFEMFAVDPCAHDTDRLVRVIGALGALAVLCLAADQVGDKTAWRSRIVATCHDALGHRRSSIHSDQLED
jgi:AcrR family transcriptional regulator